MKTSTKITLIVIPIVVAIASGVTAGMIINDNMKKEHFNQEVYDSFSLDIMLKNQLEYKDEDDFNKVVGNKIDKKDSEMKIYNLLINANVKLRETKYGYQKISFKGHAEKYAGYTRSLKLYGSYKGDGYCNVSVSKKYTLLELEFRSYMIKYDRHEYYKYYEVDAELGKNLHNTMIEILGE